MWPREGGAGSGCSGSVRLETLLGMGGRGAWGQGLGHTLPRRRSGLQHSQSAANSLPAPCQASAGTVSAPRGGDGPHQHGGTRAEPALRSCCRGALKKRGGGMMPMQVGGSAGLRGGSAQLAPPRASPGEGGTRLGARFNASPGEGGGTTRVPGAWWSMGGDIGRVGVSFGLDLSPSVGSSS